MGSKKSESTEVLLGSEVNTGSCPWPPKGSDRATWTGGHTRQTSSVMPKLGWSGDWVGGTLKVQLSGIAILAWLIVVVYGCNFQVKTPLGSDFVPLWSFWVITLYALSISIGLSFHFYSSTLGVVIAGVLQGITFVFSAYFSVIAFSALEIHGRLEKNDITRCWGGLLYGTIVGANGSILVTSLVLILSAIWDAANYTCNLSWRQTMRTRIEKVRLTVQAPSNFV